MFEIELRADGTVRLAGRLDAAEADGARSVFRTLSGPVTVDCERLEYISSAGLTVLVEAFKRLRASGHGIRLTRLQPRVRNVFTYSGLDRILPIEEA